MVNFLSTIRLAQSILKRKFPSVDKPLRIQAPQKGPLKNISPGAYFGNFTVGMCLPKGYAKGTDFEPYWCENGNRLRPFWSGIGYGFRGNYGIV